MQPPSQAERQIITEMLRNTTINSRAALLIVLLGNDTGACQIGLLAGSLGLSIPRVSMLGDTMVKDGMVDRCVPMNDLRKVSFALTDKGRAAAVSHLGLLRRLSNLSATEALSPAPAE